MKTEPRNRRRPGQALVEFALIAPVLILIFAGVLDLGRVFFTYEAAINAAREAARYCALYYAQSPDLNVVVEDEMGVASLPSGASVTASPTCDSSSLVQGQPVTVSVTLPVAVPLFSGIVGGSGSVMITAAGTMMVAGPSS